ncbi:MAG: hypothetical protein NTW46_01815 [Candidatus Nealsonbacteria bacterium]|nr:hypothetical protein [Candidatus Nealsonbacteria bacterium]
MKFEYQIILPFDGGDKKVWEDTINAQAQAGWRIVPAPCAFVNDRQMLLMEREIPEPRAKKTEISLKEALSRLGEDPFIKAHREFQEVLERVRLSSLSQRKISEPPADDDSEHPADYGGLD